MQMHQLDARIRRMLEVLKEFYVIHSLPVEEIQMTERGKDAWFDFVNGERWGTQDQEWFDVRFQVTDM